MNLFIWEIEINPPSGKNILVRDYVMNFHISSNKKKQGILYNLEAPRTKSGKSYFNDIIWLLQCDIIHI